MTLKRCVEIAESLTLEDLMGPLSFAVEREGEEVPTMFHASADFRIDDPSEPMLAVFENGSWQVAYDGDIEWMRDGAPARNLMVNAIPLKAILEDLDRFLLIHRQNHD